MAKKSSQKPVVTEAQPLVEEDHSAGSGSYQVVARRYRPKTFEELVGQTPIAQALSNALTSGRVGHAYLFTGARGVGKTSTARIFAKSLNCVEGPTLTPCGVCDSCQSVSVGEDVDVIEVDGASNRGIDEIRQLRQNASICPSRSKFKIYIIDEVHMLTREAFNALLKTLEEPPEHVKFIFCTTEPSKIPITILSRCQRFDFAGIETTEIVKRLADIAGHENVTAEDGVYEILARRAAGSMRDAQSLLEQLLSFAPENISLADVHDMLGTANDQLLFRLLDAMLRNDPATIFAELETAASEGVDFGVLVEQMMGLFRDLLVVASGGAASLMLFCSPPQFEQVKALAADFGVHRLLAALQILDQAHTRMRFSTQGRVLTELALVRISHLDHFQMITVLLDRLREGHLPIGVPAHGGAPTKIGPGEVSASIRPVQRSITPPQTPPQASVAPKATPIADGLTPQQRLAASTKRDDVDLATMDDQKALELWHDVSESITGMLGTWAGAALRVAFEKPNVFDVVFANKVAKEFCEKESPRLQNALCQAVGKSVRIRFSLEEEENVVSAPPSRSEPVPRSRAEQGALLKEASENSYVQQIEQVFGVELYDLK